MSDNFQVRPIDPSLIPESQMTATLGYSKYRELVHRLNADTANDAWFIGDFGSAKVANVKAGSIRNFIKKERVPLLALQRKNAVYVMRTKDGDAHDDANS